MNLDENSVNGSDFSQRMRRLWSFDADLDSEPCLRVEEVYQKETPASAAADWVSSMASVASNEKERLQRLEREFIGRLIEEYERAVQNGLPANIAIASMLEWASRECPRLLP